MAVLPRTRHPVGRPPSISSVAAFAASPGHAVRRPHRVACALFAVLVLLTLSALEIGGPKALTEPHAVAPDELNQLAVEEGATGGTKGAVLEPAPAAARVGAGQQQQAPAVPAEPVNLRKEGQERQVDEADREVAEAVLLDEDAAASSSSETNTLPVCDKSVVFRFAGLHGFGSEVTLLLRVAAVAGHYGYPVFLDAESWNYGAWEDYFLPLDTPFPPFSLSSSGAAAAAPPPACRLPPPETKRYKLALTYDELEHVAQPDSANTPFAPKWTHRDHVIWGARDMDGLDATFLRLFVDAGELATLHREDLELLERRKAKPAFLSPRRTLPAAHERGFVQLSRLAQVAWRPNDLVGGLTDELEQKLALRDRDAGVQGPGSLLIGVHVRLGDKFLEADHIGPAAYAPDAVAAAPPINPSSPRGLNPDLLTSYFAASIDSVHSLLSLPSIAHAFSAAHSSKDRVRALLAATQDWAREDPRERPTMALMSDDEGAVEAFRAHPLAARFRIVGTAEETPLLAAAGAKVDAPVAMEQAADAAPQGGLLEVVERKPLEEPVGQAEEARLDEVGQSEDEDEELLADKRLRRRSGEAQAGRKKRRGDARSHSSKGKKGGKRQVGKIPAGFNETGFNSLPLGSRIASSRLFVRDLTALARRADALVVTGSSNVGRLMMLLFEAANEDKGAAEVRKRELRSLDARWFPTAKFT
ncbi:hypothetical protein DMC30DRAFT_447036 [Rhodotorula diobovata]|uniref:Uncharacterized protein n=1 Tax=Rhodotorula diobovata TaxID=5288 RepID=A0A5C5FWN7_9BASI|nr:hypothetical protein DMC30DRAFT_447036 [Rhodotorula diobovata]